MFELAWSDLPLGDRLRTNAPSRRFCALEYISLRKLRLGLGIGDF